MSNLEKENTIKNTKNFTPYGTDPRKDKMVKSNYWKNRLKMAKEGYGLDVLIIDENDEVRTAVAKQGYGLDILINDENWYVREAVLYYLKKNNLTLAEWCNQNNEEVDLRKLAFSPYPEVRIAAIESGYIYKKGEIYIAPDCKFTPYGTDFEKDKMPKSNNWEDRLKMAKQGYGLDVLINDENCYIRVAVIKQGYGLDILINDEDCDVRTAIARQGYGLDILINDEDEEVQEAVKNYLYAHNLTLKQWKSNQENSKADIINQAKNTINDGKINIKNVVDNIKSTKSVLNNSINKTNKTNEIDRTNNISELPRT